MPMTRDFDVLYVSGVSGVSYALEKIVSFNKI